MGMFELGPPNDIVASAPWDDAAANAPPGEVVKRERPSLERAASGAPEVADKEGDGAKAADEESAAQKHVADAEAHAVLHDLPDLPGAAWPCEDI